MIERISAGMQGRVFVAPFSDEALYNEVQVEFVIRSIVRSCASDILD